MWVSILSEINRKKSQKETGTQSKWMEAPAHGARKAQYKSKNVECFYCGKRGKFLREFRKKRSEEKRREGHEVAGEFSNQTASEAATTLTSLDAKWAREHPRHFLMKENPLHQVSMKEENNASTNILIHHGKEGDS